jgi:hypothetical protein
MSTMQTFDLKRSQPLPPMLLPYLRLVRACWGVDGFRVGCGFLVLGLLSRVL